MMMTIRMAGREDIFHLIVDLHRAIVWIISEMKIDRQGNVEDQLIRLIEEKNSSIAHRHAMAGTDRPTCVPLNVEIAFVQTKFSESCRAKLNEIEVQFSFSGRPLGVGRCCCCSN